MIDDFENEFVGSYDGISGLQSVVLPQGWTGFAAAISVDLYGPPEILTGKSPPRALDLNDWPDATIGFYDTFYFTFGVGEPSSYVFAEIHSLTPVMLSIIPGDFNSDGVIDAADYPVWRDGLGTTYTEADYETWRANYGKTSADAPAMSATVADRSGNIPEPTTMALIVAGTALFAWSRRRRTNPAGL